MTSPVHQHTLPAPYHHYGRTYLHEDGSVSFYHMDAPSSDIGVMIPTDDGIKAYHLRTHVGTFTNAQDAANTILQLNEEERAKQRGTTQDYIQAIQSWMKE